MPAGPENTGPELESSQTEGELTKGQQLGRELEEIAAENNDEGYERQITEEVEEDEEIEEEGTEAIVQEQPARIQLTKEQRKNIDDNQYMGPIPPDEPNLPEDDPEYEAAWREYQEEYKEYMSETEEESDDESEDDS